jgi:glyoxalase/bleomycin resistance protein/dioxygenase superfamily protein
MHNVKVNNLPVGQPFGCLAQLSSVVPDLAQAVADFSQSLRVGPWFLLEKIPITGGLYRGASIDVNVSVAIGYCGALQIELIHENSTGPSIFNEVIRSRGYGIHHYGVLSKNFDGDRAKYNKLGYREVFFAVNEFPARNVYFETRGELPVLLELIETTAPVERLFAHMFSESQLPANVGRVRQVSSLQDMLSS